MNREDAIFEAREALEDVLMMHGLGGTLADWVEIHAALDTYDTAIIAAAGLPPLEEPQAICPGCGEPSGVLASSVTAGHRAWHSECFETREVTA